ncbi:hypothetical protein J3L18_23075 [Mucilaginibacter gossypii]|uniref:hypothetical protein n=1 Tax=Mucilaginibacter gossypii TaxID=551996 RepID=UPI000DCC16D6|nr:MULTISPECIES: hypothetical protein [Mucilaginibacter]QTE35998.1 hypothetical protein J3L18_23075 [Mucilaginibacter gossypii]RAV56673.1 hypothetical protein DIU36_14830 [Mucilaginibacter rubeus]
MTLKLTYDNAKALMHLFEKFINPEQPADIAESLVKDIMFQVFKKLRNKVESRFKGDGYSLSLTDIEAKAYYVYFNNRNLGNDWIYEQNMITTHLLVLDQTYA